jgi:hypothetical protein
MLNNRNHFSVQGARSTAVFAINELATATEGTGIDRRQVAQTKSSVNIGFSGLCIGNLAVILID